MSATPVSTILPADQACQLTESSRYGKWKDFVTLIDTAIRQAVAKGEFQLDLVYVDAAGDLGWCNKIFGDYLEDYGEKMFRRVIRSGHSTTRGEVLWNIFWDRGDANPVHKALTEAGYTITTKFEEVPCKIVVRW